MLAPAHQEALYFCSQDPNSFIEFVLGVEQANVHREMQRHLSTYDDCYVELHRGCGKTMQIAARVAFEIGKNPNIRVKYVQQTDDEAEKTSGMIRTIIESEAYRLVFPEVEPDMDAWGKGSFKVKRNGLGRDATVEAKGIGGRAGGRADLLIADDVCDLRNAIQMPAERDKVKESWATNWSPMLDVSAGKRPRTWKVGTPYHVSDITADWRRRHDLDGSLLRRPVVNMRSPWPDFTHEMLVRKREDIGPIAFGRAYLLEPVTSEMLVFSAEWLDRTMYDTIPQERRGKGQWECAIDWAYTDVSAGAKVKGDPDYTVCLIGFRSDDGHLYIEDMIRKRVTMPEFARVALDRCFQLNVKRGWAEGNGPQREIVRSFNAMSHFPVTAVERERDKLTRAVASQSFVEGARFHIKGMRDERTGRWMPIPALQPLYDEMTTFPAGEHDDTVDCAIDLIGADALYHTTQMFSQPKRRKVKRKDLAGAILGHPEEEYAYVYEE